MEVANDCSALLSNHEVLTLLSDIQSGKGHKKLNSQQQNLATICYETVKYLEKTACKNQSPESIASFVRSLEPFKLTKAEKLQVVNQQPTTGVEVQLLIEEIEERLSEEQTEQLLNLVADHFPNSQITSGDKEQMDVS